MATQNNPVLYAEAIQYQLADVCDPVPVYASFNRNYATQPKFVVWNLRNVHSRFIQVRHKVTKVLTAQPFRWRFMPVGCRMLLI